MLNIQSLKENVEIISLKDYLSRNGFALETRGRRKIYFVNISDEYRLAVYAISMDTSPKKQHSLTIAFQKNQRKMIEKKVFFSNITEFEDQANAFMDSIPEWIETKATDTVGEDGEGENSNEDVNDNRVEI